MRFKNIVPLFFIMGLVYSQVIINEVLYDPTGVDTGQEWIELKNAGGSAVDIGGYDINATSGDYLTFPTLNVPAGDFVIVHWNTDGINDTDFSDDIAHIYTGSTGFSNMGNTTGWVALFNSTTHSSSTIIDYMEYGSGDQTWENSAVTAGIWTEDNFAVDVSEGSSLEYDGSGDLGSDFVEQVTPSQGSDNSLPVELVSFLVEQSTEGVRIKWRTESEFENIGFIIERKTDGANWIEIVSYKTDEFLLGQGTTSYPWDYEYTDRFVDKGKKYYYRLADVDQNGIVTYHQSENIILESNPLSATPDRLSLTTYPNPFNPTVNILYSVLDNDLNVKIDIYNIKGELVNSLLDKNKSQGWHSMQWSGLDSKGNAVPGGTYFCQIKAGNEVRNTKIVYLK